MRDDRWRRTAASTVGPVLLVLGTGAATYSVVRFRLFIVATYVALAVVLAVSLRRSPRRPPEPSALAAALVVAGVVTWTVPAFTYLTAPQASTVRALLAGAAVVAGLLVALGHRHVRDAALVVAVAGYLLAAQRLLQGDPAPSIDVWYTLQGAADATASGANPYTSVWVGPPGVMAAFTYLPGTAVLLGPGRWFGGDVRLALVAVTLLAVVAMRGLRTPTAAAAAALLVLLPGTATQVEQAWTEPLLLACLAGAALALTRGRTRVAIVLLALGIASKQHLALLLPLLAAWPRFGVRRTAAVVGVAGLVVAPWLVADPRAMLDDTVGLLVRFPPLRFADSLYIAAIETLGWTPPFWVTGAVVVAVIAVTGLAVHRRDPDPGTFLRWCALVLLVANLVNKQAFYNQYWLVAALVVLSWGLPGPERPVDDAVSPPRPPARSGVPATAAPGPAANDPAG